MENETNNVTSNNYDIGIGLDYEKLHQPYIVFYLLLTSLSSLVGVVGNILTIATFATTAALHQTRNAFIVNLAVADLLVTGIVMPFSVYGVIGGKLYFDNRPNLCRFLASICAPGCLASMYTICWISCTRYFYICKFGSYADKFSKQRTAVFIFSIWVLCFLVHLPNHVGWGDSKYSTGFQLCTLDMENFSYSFFYGCFMVVAIGITFGFYLKIYLTLKKSRLSMKMIAGPAKSNSNQNHHHHVDNTFRNEIKLAKTSFKIFIIFVLTWTPTAILILIGINSVVPSAVYLYSVYMAHSNSMINFFIYYVDNEMFKKGFQTVISKMFKKKNAVTAISHIKLHN